MKGHRKKSKVELREQRPDLSAKVFVALQEVQSFPIGSGGRAAAVGVPGLRPQAEFALISHFTAHFTLLDLGSPPSPLNFPSTATTYQIKPTIL